LKSPGIVESENFFLRILHSFCVLGECAESILSGKYFSVYGEYGTQNRLRIHGKYFNIFGEYGERIFAYMEMQRDPWRILHIYTIWDRLSQKPSHATVPLTLFCAQVCCDVRDVRPAGPAGPGGRTAPSQVHRKGGIRSMSSLK
jgi:hypothetical protein